MGATIGIDLEKAAQLLQAGKLVAIPTETVYGLAANGLNVEAVSGIFAAKNRPTFDPLILHVCQIAQAKSLCSVWPKAAQKLAEAFWPGPLTLVLPKAAEVPDLVTADNPTVAVRMPNNAMTLALLRSLTFPLAAPSANPFGYVSPTTAQHVADQLQDRIDYILDGGSCAIGIESTILAIDEAERVTVLRLGGLDLESLTEVLGHSVQETLSTHSNPQAPGQLDQHYSPGAVMIPWDPTNTHLEHAPWTTKETESQGILWFSKSEAKDWLTAQEGSENKEITERLNRIKHYHLSENGDDREAAMNLFGVLRQFDKDQCSCVYFGWVPEKGLGRAINDRLKRAAAKRPLTDTSVPKN